MQPLKILQIYEIGPRNATDNTEAIGGHILELSKTFIKLGNEVTFLTGAAPGAPKHEEFEGLKILRTDWLGMQAWTWTPVNLTVRRQLLFTPAVIRSMKGMQRFDIFHGHLYNSGLMALFLAKVLKGRAINTIHGSYYPIWNFISQKMLEATFYEMMEKALTVFLAKNCDAQIHTASYSMKLAKKWGAPTERLHFIDNGIDLRRFNPSVKASWRPTCCEYMILTARRLVRKNGVEYLIKALPMIRSRHKVHLVIAGEGPEKIRLMELAKKIQVYEHITFLGLIPNREIASLLVACDVAVLPSLIEAPGLFLLEAMAMAKPVVASRVGSIPDVVSHMRDGIMVEPRRPEQIAEMVNLVLSDESLSRKLGKRAKERAKDYSIESTAKSLLKLYEKVLQTKGEEREIRPA